MATHKQRIEELEKERKDMAKKIADLREKNPEPEQKEPEQKEPKEVEQPVVVNENQPASELKKLEDTLTECDQKLAELKQKSDEEAIEEHHKFMGLHDTANVLRSYSPLLVVPKKNGRFRA